MRRLVELRAENEIPDLLLLLEHPPVITLGRQARREHLLLPVDALRRRGVEVVPVERGGDVTYHGPGQLVGYPIVRLPNLRGVVPFVRKMEETILRFLSAHGVRAYRRVGYPGVWTERGKICAIGMAVRRNVTFHGFALNLGTDLTAYRWIVPCGLPDPVTRLSDFGIRCSPQRAAPRIAELWQEVFAYSDYGEITAGEIAELAHRHTPAS